MPDNHSDNQSSDSHVPRFDEVSKNYLGDLNNNLRLAGGDGHYFYALKIEHVLRLLKNPPKNILDFGCATGEFTKLLAATFPGAKVTGYDPAVECIKVAQQNLGSSAISFTSELSTFSDQPDLVIATGVFHHISPSEKQRAVDDIFKLLRPGGDLIVFEHNPFSPLTQLIVKMAAVDKGATLITRSRMENFLKSGGFKDILSKYMSFFPPLLKFLLPAEKYLEQCPAGAQYLVTGKKN